MELVILGIVQKQVLNSASLQLILLPLEVLDLVFEDSITTLIDLYIMVNSANQRAINLVELDKLVADEALVSPNLPCVKRIRQQIELGLIQEAIKLIEDNCPQLLVTDPRYRFALECQLFLELSQGDDLASIKFLRRELAPRAMDSFDPEAFVTFKQLLPSLILPRLDDNSSLDLKRKNLASSVYHACLQLQPLESDRHAFKPLTLLIAYMSRIYLFLDSSTLPSHQEGMRDLIKRLLLYPVTKDSPPLPPIFESMAQVQEVDVQALIQCCGSTRREAVEAISRRADLIGAMKQEISRVRFNSHLFQELLDEYTESRGLSQAKDASGSSSVRHHLNLQSPLRSQSRSPPNKVLKTSPKEEGDQRGGVEVEAPTADLSALQELARTDRADQVEAVVEMIAPGYFSSRDDLLFEFRSCWFTVLLKEGRHSEALAYSRSHLSPLASRNPQLQVSLQQVSSAMIPSLLSNSVISQTGSSKLHSLISSLIKDLQIRHRVTGPRSDPIQSPTRAIISKDKGSPRLRAEAPPTNSDSSASTTRLVNLIDFLMAQHASWCKKEKFPSPGHCPFFTALGIHNLLRQAEAQVDPGNEESAADEDLEEVEEENGQDEEAILRIMEILELPRSAAIDLLTAHGGDAEAAIYSVFGA